MERMRLYFLLLVCGSVLLLTSCKTQKIVYNYLEDLKDTTTKKEFYIAEPVIQKNDQLSVQIYSASLDPQVDQLYNQPGMGTSGGAATQTAQLYGYLVDQKGNIELPRIGIIHAEGLTKDQLADVIKTKLKGQ